MVIHESTSELCEWASCIDVGKIIWDEQYECPETEMCLECFENKKGGRMTEAWWTQKRKVGKDLEEEAVAFLLY